MSPYLCSSGHNKRCPTSFVWSRLDFQNLGALCRMTVFRATINLELAEHLASQRILGKHSANRLFNNIARRPLHHVLEACHLETALIAGIAVINLVPALLARDLQFVGIDDDDVVAGIHVRGKLRFVLATEVAEKVFMEMVQ